MLFQIKQIKNLNKKFKNVKNLVPKIVLVIIGVVVGVSATFLYIQKFGIPFKSVSQDALAAQEARAVEKIINKVEKLIITPQDEEPVLATIVNVEELVKKEPFYANAQNGDIVLMFQKNLKAIIYSPERDMIVNVGPIYVPEQNTPTTTQAELETSVETEETVDESSTE